MNRRKRLALAVLYSTPILLIGVALLVAYYRAHPPELHPGVLVTPIPELERESLVRQEGDLCPSVPPPPATASSQGQDTQGLEDVLVLSRKTPSAGTKFKRRDPDGPAEESTAYFAYEMSVDADEDADDSPALEAVYGVHALETFARDAEVPEDEVWIIAKAPQEEGFTDAEEYIEGAHEDTPDPGSGAMVANVPPNDEQESETMVPLPLQHTAVDAAIAGHISTVRVRQQFANPFDTRIEAVYVFPLPQQAAVSEFLMVIGARTIRGILREKEEAEAIYQQARDQGYQASLLVQRRPNIFEQKVANIEPGKAIDVDITYFNTLAYQDGWYSFVFPTVVGPRFNPPGHPDPVQALPRGGHTKTPGATGVDYLAPTERSGHDLGISVRVDAGVPIEDITATHEISVERDGPAVATVQLAQRTTIPNRDFVLDFRIAGETVKSGLMTYKDPDTGDGFFSLMMIPPMDSTDSARRPMELVFVIDTSGSMQGRPLDQAKQAVATALGLLNPDDTFQIIRFSDNASQFGREPVPATAQNLAAARRYLANLHGGGGTMMVEGIKAALGFPHHPSRYRFISFLTDGYIGNEAEILAEVHRRIGHARIFSFGVGESVNRYLMERMAKVGRGTVAYLGLNDSADAVMDAFLTRVRHAALTDIDIDWGGMTVSDTYPARLPDLFVGRPLVVSGKFRGDPASVTVCGTVDGARRPFVVEAVDAGSAGPSLAKVWARANIAELSDRQATTGDPHGKLRDTIKRIALQHQLASAYTSFVAVDSSDITEGEYGVTVHQAVPVPEGVRYETTVVSEGN